MRIKNKYFFGVDNKTQEILNALTNYSIKHKITKGIGKIFISFEIFEDNIYWEKLNFLMNKHNLNSITECVYTKKECDNAAWLSLRSKFRWEYPQPDEAFEYKGITYNNEKYCNNCGCGLVQKENFRIKKEPKWGSRNFLMLNWIHDELFINNKAANVLTTSKLTGFELTDVNYAKKSQIVENIKQIKVIRILESNIVINKDDIKKELVCEACGCKKYVLNGREKNCTPETFKDIDADIIKSNEVFGDGQMCSRIICVSNSFYRIIKQNNLGKDLIFEPINLIS